MIIDCDQCAMQYTGACDDCIVTALLAPSDRVIDVSEAEVTALRNLADGGMIAPLRLVVRPVDQSEATG